MARRVMAAGKSALGPELVDTANLASVWESYGNNTKSQDGDAVKISYVNSSDGAYIYLNQEHGLSQNTVVGKQYLLTCQAKVTPGSSVLLTTWNINIVAMDVTSTEFVNYSAIVTVTNPTWALMVKSMGPGESIWVRNISVRKYR